ncbi:MAG TPA: GFA family protein [Phenylobacterium sp.]|jgi:hypothetical protein|uniref:GFA family protein n=1 Tax=Phenylobacterium sp. TaxID=1871053 RepID=UPI002D5C9EC9|nr:GFA family protein [Phenylobacterium sp.]HZZ66948.1 GFA family protein [Phenylobacterium sp.]
MHVDGQCHCGVLAFTAEVDPESVTVCHCTDCQAMSGSAFRANIACPADAFHFVRGEPAIYVKTAESGAKRRMAFCAACGGQIYSSAEHEPKSYALRTGTISQRAAFAPAKQIWMRSAVPWARDALDGVPAFATEASPSS